MNSRQLAPCAYVVAFTLIAIPLFDAAMSVAPFHLGTAQWRFGAVGLFSNALMLTAVGYFLAVATALIQGHAGLQRVLRILGWTIGAGILCSIVLFGLDALQTRAAVAPRMRLSFVVASVTAVGKLLLGALTFALLARACRPSRRAKGKEAVDSAAGPLIVRAMQVQSGS
jgi:hypothetical protein